MNLFAVGSFLITAFNVIICALILRARAKNPTTMAYFAWSASVMVWSLGYAITLQGLYNYDVTLTVNKICHAAAFLIGPFFFNLCAHLSNANNKYKKIFTTYYILGVTGAIVMVCTNLFVKGLWSFGPLRYQPLGGKFYLIFVVFFLICNIHGFALVLLRSLRESEDKKKKQLKLFLIATGIGYSLSAQLFIQAFHISLQPYAVYIMFVYLIILGHAIHRYQFLDVRLIVRRALVFAGLLSFVFGIYTFATLFIRTVLSGFFTVSDFWANAVAIGLIVIGYDPLRGFLINLTDKYLFQKSYNYHQVLKDASRGMAKIESLHHLLGLVLHFITMKMRVENAAVLALDVQDRLFRLQAARGYHGKPVKISLNIDHPLIIKMRMDHEAVQLHDIVDKLESEKDESEKNDLKIIINELNTLNAKCAIPSFLGTELRNVLLIGDKKSGEPHTSEDINLLMTLAQESSIAIENARLYDEAIKKQKQLGQINDQLENSKKMLVQALAQAEGANKQLQDTQAQLIHEQKMATLGRLAASVGHEVNNPLTILSMNVSRAILKFRKNPDLKVNEILDVFDKMEKNIERIKAVVNTLTGLLKKSEKGKFEPLSLKLILEETLPLVQFQTYMDNLSGTEVELNVPGSVPLIRGDLERLQEIFLNLFINAYHAMAGRRFRKIRVDAELDPTEEGMVAIHFIDNGSGMSEETMKKIFNYGYTTKPPGKGSGMGLYMCKYIVELHGGTIRVKSTLGEGTTFTVTLPVYKEEPTAASASQKKPVEANPAETKSK